MFLAGISDCIINTKLSEPEISAEQLRTAAAHQENRSSGSVVKGLLGIAQQTKVAACGRVGERIVFRFLRHPSLQVFKE